MKNRMKKEFLGFEGGLFSEVEKADVGDSFAKLAENGVALMGWADPFMPDFSIPEHIMEKTLEAIKSPVAAHYTAPTGNMELRLDRKLQEKRIFPAIDLNQSGTRREDLLMSPEELEAIWIMRKALNAPGTKDVTESIIDSLAHTKNNASFIQAVKMIFE